jgi:hypothetical protein
VQLIGMIERWALVSQNSLKIVIDDKTKINSTKYLSLVMTSNWNKKNRGTIQAGTEWQSFKMLLHTVPKSDRYLERSPGD